MTARWSSGDRSVVEVVETTTLAHMPVVIVTDSTASLPPEVAAEHGVVVVPLQVVIGATVYDEGADGATPDLVAAALKEWKPVSTSRPGPAALLEVYEQAARDGATEIVSVHLSGDMSGTFESAQLAARDASVRVVPVDTRQVGVATGFAVLAAADVLAAGGDADAAAEAARARAAASASLFYVDTLEYLRRGGRIGHAAALLGGALSVKPLLKIEDGVVASLERVRTSARALSRLEELAVQAAGEGPVDVWVGHLANADRAADLAQRLGHRLEANLEGREVWSGELGAVLGAHVGPGMIAVCVAPRL
ncbi:Protein DegV [Nocardioides sp. T2.26MG-1]|nr:Protein DegV [Nocardioides sp. T2.26MG-1]